MGGTDQVTADSAIVERVLNLMSTRMSWTLASKLIPAAGLHLSRGWGDTISAFRSKPPGGEALRQCKERLVNDLGWHTLVGNKQVTRYDLTKLNPEWQEKIAVWGSTLDGTALSMKLGLQPQPVYAVPYSQAELTPMAAHPPRLLYATRVDSMVYFHYFSVRPYILRETIDLSNFPEEDRARFGSYHELIGVKLKNIPCFDTCVLDIQNKRLETRVDFMPGMHSDAQDGAQHRLLDEFNRLTLAEIQLTPAGQGLVNFFGAVAGIYKNPQAGRVSMLGFVATDSNSSSNNRGNILRRQNQDLRKDGFHVGGRNAVKSITPYTIGSTWPSLSGKEDLHLELHGTARMIYASGVKAITTANFIGCANGRDYDFLSQQLTNHLK